MSVLVPANPTDAQIERENKVLAQLNIWLEAIPTSGEDGLLAILEQIVATEDPDLLDAAWNTAGFGDWLGYALRIDNPRKAASKLAGGLGWFLIVDAVVHATGEKLTLTTSSVAIMAQILVAAGRGMLPKDFVPLEKEEPTENGFYPQHLKVWKNHMPVAPEPAAQMRRGAIRASAGTSREERFAEQIKRDVAADKAKTTAGATEEPGF